MSDVNAKRQGVGRRMDDGTCAAHSGMEMRGKLLLWFLGLLISVSVLQAKLLLDVKNGMATSDYRFEAVDTAIEDVRNHQIKAARDAANLAAKQADIDSRLKMLERFELIHRDGRTND